MTTGNPLEIAIENRLESLESIYDGFEAFSNRVGLPDSMRRVLLLVVEELVTNTIRYGYADGQTDNITIGLNLTEDAVHVIIRDHAKPFDVSKAKDEPEETSLEDMQVGGLGLFLVHQFARSITNRRSGSENVTEIELPMDAEAPD
ncbi:MAG: ATP-binding protein [Pseudomonadota bacterium]